MLLEAYCKVTKLDVPKALDIVGIATESGINEFSSEDSIYYDAHDWPNEEKAEAKRLKRELSLLTDIKKYDQTEKEYPDTPRYGRNQNYKRHKIPRNAPCPCGSGKKYKYCCMRKKSNSTPIL